MKRGSRQMRSGQKVQLINDVVVQPSATLPLGSNFLASYPIRQGATGTYKSETALSELVVVEFEYHGDTITVDIDPRDLTVVT